MLSTDDLTQMNSDLMNIRDDNDVSITIRRENETLDPQSVRIARLLRGRSFDSEGGEEQRADVVVVGDTDFDVQVADRFTVNEILYRVTFIRPNQTVAKVAEAVAIE